MCQPRLRLAPLTLAILLAATPQADAATFWWNGSDGNWADSANWNSTELPSIDNGDEVQMDSGGTVRVTTPDASAARLIIGDTYSLTHAIPGHVVIDAGHLVTDFGLIGSGELGGGSVTLDNGATWESKALAFGFEGASVSLQLSNGSGLLLSGERNPYYISTALHSAPNSGAVSIDLSGGSLLGTQGWFNLQGGSTPTTLQLNSASRWQHSNSTLDEFNYLGNHGDIDIDIGTAAAMELRGNLALGYSGVAQMQLHDGAQFILDGRINAAPENDIWYRYGSLFAGAGGGQVDVTLSGETTLLSLTHLNLLSWGDGGSANLTLDGASATLQAVQMNIGSHYPGTLLPVTGLETDSAGRIDLINGASLSLATDAMNNGLLRLGAYTGESGILSADASSITLQGTMLLGGSGYNTDYPDDYASGGTGEVHLSHGSQLLGGGIFVLSEQSQVSVADASYLSLIGLFVAEGHATIEQGSVAEISQLSVGNDNSTYDRLPEAEAEILVRNSQILGVDYLAVGVGGSMQLSEGTTVTPGDMGGQLTVSGRLTLADSGSSIEMSNLDMGFHSGRTPDDPDYIPAAAGLLEVSAGAHLSIAQAVYLVSDSTLRLTGSGTQAELNTHYWFSLEHGTLEILDGATLSTNELRVAAYPLSSGPVHIRVDGSESYWHNQSALNLGYDTDASVPIQMQIDAGTVHIGSGLFYPNPIPGTPELQLSATNLSLGSNASLSVNGDLISHASEIHLAPGASLQVGDNSPIGTVDGITTITVGSSLAQGGNLHMSGGLFDSQGVLQTSTQTGSRSTLDLDAGATWNHAGELQLGLNGESRLSLRDYTDFGIYDLTLFGGESTLPSPYHHSIGSGGDVDVEVLSASFLWINGYASLSIAEAGHQVDLLVSGDFSYLMLEGVYRDAATGDELRGETVLGNGGSASLTFSDHAMGTLTDLTVARGAGATGEVRIENGATVSVAEELRLGDNGGHATLTVANGQLSVGNDTHASDLRIAEGSSASFSGSLSDIAISGDLDLDEVGSNSLTLSNGARLTIDGALIIGDDDHFSFTTDAYLETAAVTGDLVNGGIFAPGHSPAATLIDGDYTQLAEGDLLIELGGLLPGIEYDTLSITGMAQLDGLLQVSTIGGFVLSDGNRFDFLSADGGISGAFSQMLLPTLSDGLSWHFEQGSHSLSLWVGSSSAVAAPEPGTNPLLALAALLAAARLRRHRGPAQA